MPGPKDDYDDAELSGIFEGAHVTASSSSGAAANARPKAPTGGIPNRGIKDIQLKDKPFGTEDLISLSTDEYGRFMPPHSRDNHKVGHVVIYKQDGVLKGAQFAYPTDEITVRPSFADPETDPEKASAFTTTIKFRQLQNISLVRKGFVDKETGQQVFGTVVRAQTPGGSEMVGNRPVTMVKREADGSELVGELHRLSPIQGHTLDYSDNPDKIFYGACAEKMPIFTKDLPPARKKELVAEMKELGKKSMHKRWLIDRESVLYRKQREDLPRVPQQSVVMGRAFKGTEHGKNPEYRAVDIISDLADEYKDELSKERKDLMKKMTVPYFADADTRRKQPISKLNYRGELTHLEGCGLTHKDKDPQTADNLAAAPMHMNTRMMVNGERVVQWILLNTAGTAASGDVKFNNLLDAPIVEDGHMKFTITKDGRSVEVHDPLNPWRKYAIFNKVTDRTLAVLAARMLLDDVQPISISSVRNVGANFMPYRVPVDPRLPPIPKLIAAPAAPVAAPVAPVTVAVAVAPVAAPPVAAPVAPAAVRPAAKRPALEAAPAAKRHKAGVSTKQPTDRKKVDYGNSAVSIDNSPFESDYTRPWINDMDEGTGGSGFFFERNGKRYIMTNSHVVRNHVFLSFCLAGQTTKYTAEVVPYGVSYEHDLAILEVTDPTFDTTKIIPLIFGDMVQIGQDVTAVGFPVGGDNVCVTTGKISRIQTSKFDNIGGLYPLEAQTDTSLNPGNSGCAILSDGKVVGVCYQGVQGKDGLNYIIPMPLVKQMIAQTFADIPKGIPALNFDADNLLNPWLRRVRGLVGKYSKQSGILITDIPKLSALYGSVQKHDILTAIDDVVISNNGLVSIPGIAETIEYPYLFQRKHIGQQIKVSVLRMNPETKELEPKEFMVTLKHRAGEISKIGPPEFDKRPTYYIHSAAVFQPLTPNFIEDGSGVEFKHMTSEDQKYITEMPADQYGEQIILINIILECPDTVDYKETSNVRVEKINGKVIKSMSDVISAMENHTEETHVIDTKSGEVIILKNMSKPQHDKLLVLHGIPSDRSPDLQPGVVTVAKKTDFALPATDIYELDLDDEEMEIDPIAVPETVAAPLEDVSPPPLLPQEHAPSDMDVCPPPPSAAPAGPDNPEDSDADLRLASPGEREEGLDTEDEPDTGDESAMVDDDEAAEELMNNPVAWAQQILALAEDERATDVLGGPRESKEKIDGVEYPADRGAKMQSIASHYAKEMLEQSKGMMRFAAERRRLRLKLQAEEDEAKKRAELGDDAPAPAAASSSSARPSRVVESSDDEEIVMDDHIFRWPDPNPKA